MKYIVHDVKEYLCDCCGDRLWNHVGAPYIEIGNMNYCHECAFKLGIITESEYLKEKNYDAERYKASIVDGYVYISRKYKKRRTQNGKDNQ